LNITAYDLAARCTNLREIEGQMDNPHIMAMLTLDSSWPQDDEVPWCSGFVNWIAWWLRLPRSKSLLARSWLGVGTPVRLVDAEVGFDVAILMRGTGNQPGPENTTAKGHVGFFAGLEAERVMLLGGNQGNAVNIKGYPANRVLGVRRLLHGR